MNKFTNEDRALVLAQALPYIKKYVGKTVVIKYGGNAMIDEGLKDQVMKDIALLALIGVKVVLVHGGGPEINETMAKLGKKPEFIDGLRVTDKETIDIVQMVLTGKVNKSLVALLGKRGASAVGISGIDNKLIEVTQKDPRLGYVGEITKINIEIVNDILESGHIPVISALGCDNMGQAYNINGDTAAAYIAGALEAEGLIMMTDVCGILADVEDRDSLITNISVDEAKKLEENGTISGGMIPKVECCIKAIESGVKQVVIMDGTVPHSILMELLTNEGAGSLIHK